jgi:hypothetical protein
VRPPGSDVDSIHHVISNATKDIRDSESRKRTRASISSEAFTQQKRRKSTVSEDGAEETEHAKRGSHSHASPSNNTMAAPSVQPSGFTAVNRGIVVEVSRPVPAANPPNVVVHSRNPSLKDFTASMRYRGKLWEFSSIAHKAKVLEQILLQEEKDVEAYPILAFSKSAKKAGLGGGTDSDATDTALKDYFRFYTHFMTDRFPSNEKILLANGVTPSA